METETYPRTFQVKSGYDLRESMTFRNPTDVKEMIDHCDKHSHIWLRDRQGNARRVKVNGKVRTWKRDPVRVEVPYKYGLYEYGTLYTRDMADILIPVVE